MKVELFKLEHLDQMELQPEQEHMRGYFHLLKEIDLTVAWTALFNGEPKCCAGVLLPGGGRAVMWCYLSKDAGRYMRAIHRKAVWWVENLTFDRLEAMVATDFAAGHRWVKLLGFYMEQEKMAAPGPDGKDYALYVRSR